MTRYNLKLFDESRLPLLYVGGERFEIFIICVPFALVKLLLLLIIIIIIIELGCACNYLHTI